MPERRFKFRAQVVLDLRQRRDEEAQRARAVAQAAVQLAEQAVAEANERLRLACEAPRDPDVALEWYRNWLVGLRAVIQQRTEALAARCRERDVALARALATRRDLRVIERLREKRLRGFRLENDRVEQRQIDALAVQRFGSATRSSKDEAARQLPPSR